MANLWLANDSPTMDIKAGVPPINTVSLGECDETRLSWPCDDHGKSTLDFL